MAKVDNFLDGKLSEYIALLKALCQSYAAGNEVVALSIATAIRVLVHDGKFKSLLTQLNATNLLFLSTNFSSHTEKVHLGLIRRINVGVHDGKGGEAKYWPLCDERYFKTPVEHFVLLAFDAWWNEYVFCNEQYKLSRQDLVMAVANKDGGAHYDDKVDERYDQFRKTWSGGSSLKGIHSGESRGYDNVPVRPAIRQIAHEILHSGIETQL